MHSIHLKALLYATPIPMKIEGVLGVLYPLEMGQRGDWGVLWLCGLFAHIQLDSSWRVFRTFPFPDLWLLP